MSKEYILDLGEDGRVIIASTEEVQTDLRGPAQAGIGEDFREYVREIIADPKEIILKPLSGLGKLFVKAIPALDTDNFQLDEFTLEFEMGLGTEYGADNPIVTAKVMPQGAFKCSYKWARKQK